jgi:hypothetical protein
LLITLDLRSKYCDMMAGSAGLSFLEAVDFFLVFCFTGDGGRSWAVRGRGPEGAILTLELRSVLVAFLVVLRRAGPLVVWLLNSFLGDLDFGLRIAWNFSVLLLPSGLLLLLSPSGTPRGSPPTGPLPVFWKPGVLLYCAKTFRYCVNEL